MFPRTVVRGINLTIGTAFEDLNPFDQATDQVAILGAGAKLDVTSAATADDGDPVGTGARTLTIYGFDANDNPTSETITMNGRTIVTTATTWTLIQDAKVATAGSGKTNAGIIYGVKTGTGGSYTNGVPGTVTSAILKIAAGENSQGTGASVVPANVKMRAVSLVIGASVQPGFFRIISELSGVQENDLTIAYNIGTTQLDLRPFDIWWSPTTVIRLQAAANSAGGKASAMLVLERIA